MHLYRLSFLLGFLSGVVGAIVFSRIYDHTRGFKERMIERKRRKLEATQLNIAGHIKNTLQKKITESLFFGDKDQVESETEKNFSKISIFNPYADNPKQPVVEINTACWYKEEFVRVHLIAGGEILERISAKGVNDQDLKILIEKAFKWRRS